MSTIPRYDIEILVYKLKGQPIGYSFAMLDAQVERQTNALDSTDMETDAEFKVRMQAAFPGSEWKGINVRKPWTAEHKRAALEAIRHYDKDEKTYLSDELLWPGAFVEKAVLDWDFEQPPNASGLRALGDKLSETVFALVVQACYPNPSDDPNFQSLLTTRWNGSGQETPKDLSSTKPSKSGVTGPTVTP